MNPMRQFLRKMVVFLLVPGLIGDPRTALALAHPLAVSPGINSTLFSAQALALGASGQIKAIPGNEGKVKTIGMEAHMVTKKKKPLILRLVPKVYATLEAAYKKHGDKGKLVTAALTTVDLLNVELLHLKQEHGGQGTTDVVVNVDAEVHKSLIIAAETRGTTMNRLINSALWEYLPPDALPGNLKKITRLLWTGALEAETLYAGQFDAALKVALELSDPAAPSYEYMEIGFSEMVAFPIEAVRQAVSWIEEKIQSGKKVLIYCADGSYRSKIIALAYLYATRHDLNFVQAAELVQSHSERPLEDFLDLWETLEPLADASKRPPQSFFRLPPLSPSRQASMEKHEAVAYRYRDLKTLPTLATTVGEIIDQGIRYDKERFPDLLSDNGELFPGVQLAIDGQAIAFSPNWRQTPVPVGSTVELKWAESALVASGTPHFGASLEKSIFPAILAVPFLGILLASSAGATPVVSEFLSNFSENIHHLVLHNQTRFIMGMAFASFFANFWLRPPKLRASWLLRPLSDTAIKRIRIFGVALCRGAIILALTTPLVVSIDVGLKLAFEKLAIMAIPIWIIGQIMSVKFQSNRILAGLDVFATTPPAEELLFKIGLYEIIFVQILHWPIFGAILTAIVFALAHFGERLRSWGDYVDGFFSRAATIGVYMAAKLLAGPIDSWTNALDIALPIAVLDHVLNNFHVQAEQEAYEDYMKPHEQARESIRTQVIRQAIVMTGTVGWLALLWYVLQSVNPAPHVQSAAALGITGSMLFGFNLLKRSS